MNVRISEEDGKVIVEVEGRGKMAFESHDQAHEFLALICERVSTK